MNVCVSENFSIPSLTNCIVLMKVSGSKNNVVGSFNPNKEKLANLGLICAHLLVVVNDEFIPVRLTNTNDKAITIFKNTIVGTFEFFDYNKNQENINVLEECVNNRDDFETLKRNVESNVTLSGVQKTQVHKLLEDFRDIFSHNKKDLGFCKYLKHEIDIKENSPIQQMKTKVPLNVEDWVDNQVDKLKEMGVIRESTSPWSAPVVVVKKKSGDFRLCIDFRRLNSLTIKPIYSIPDTQSLFNHLEEAKVFSSIDVSNAYYQIGIREEDKKLTAFSTRKGHWEFNRMPFGLSGAPFSFQRLMNIILREENWLMCLVYLDDVLIFAKNFDEHMRRLKIVFQKIKDSGIKLSPLKCNLFQKEVQYLGHLITESGIKTDPSKISAIKEWPLPNNVSELRSFLGFCNYYRKFIKDFACMTGKMEEVLKQSSQLSNNKNPDLVWNAEGKSAFQELKICLCSAPCLTYPNKQCQFILDTDASFETIGCVLSQVQNGDEKVIAYGSRKLTKSEKQYCVTRKELLAVYYFVLHFKQYLLGRRFIIRTDHKALKWLMNWEKPNTNQYCAWIAELETYDFCIEHRAGEKHKNADFLSRPPPIPCQQCDILHEKPLPKRNVKLLHIAETDGCEDLSMSDVKKIHEDLGHIGHRKLLSVLKGFNTKKINLTKMSLKVINNCQFCLERKQPIWFKKSKMNYVANYPFEKIAMDIAGPLTRTKTHNLYILSIIDVFSRYIILAPLKDIRSNSVITVLKERVVANFGYPNEIITDGGSYFNSSEFNVFCKDYSIDHHITSPYHPSSNGLIERYFKTVKDMVSTTSRAENKNWDEVLHMVELGMRSSENKTTGRSPFAAIYSFNPRVSRYKVTENCFTNVRNTMKFKIGDFVYIKSPNSHPGIYEKRYFGPGKIINYRQYKSYCVEYQGKVYIRHEDHLKLCHNVVEESIGKISVESRSSKDKSMVGATNTRFPKRNRRPVIKYGFGSERRGM